MDKYIQFKKVIKKLRKKHSKDGDNEDNKKVKLRKRAFSFFKSVPCEIKLSPNAQSRSDTRKSVDVAELQRSRVSHNDSMDCMSVDTYLRSSYNCHSNTATSDITDACSSTLAIDTNDECSVSNSATNNQLSSPISHATTASLVPVTKDSIYHITKDPCNNSNVGSTNISRSSNSMDSLKYILRRLFNYPDNFYICLSYIITIFLFISTVYVAYQVDRLEGNLTHLLAQSQNNIKTFIHGDLRQRSQLLKARRLLATQIAQMTEIMKNIESRLS